MSKPKNIKQTYADALFWAMSPKSKDKPYHITRTQESILRKLIHYDCSNPKITYSNEVIGQHIYLEASTIEKVIPALTKMKFIKTITFQVNDGSGRITSRRIININWDFIKEVLTEVPVVIASETAEDIEPSITEAHDESSSQSIEEPTISSNKTVYSHLEEEDEITLGFESNLPLRKPSRTIAMEPRLIDGIMNVPSDLINFGLGTRLTVQEALEKKPTVNYTQGLICFDDGTSYAGELLKVNDETNPKAIYMTRNFIETGEPF